MDGYLKIPWSIEDTVKNLEAIKECLEETVIIRNLHGKGEKDAEEVRFDFDRAINALKENQQYKERLKQLRHAEVLSFKCKLPDGRICHFSDFLDFLENGYVE